MRSVEFDGKKQRNALTAAERSIEALGKGDAAAARRAVARAGELDQLGVYLPLVSAVGDAADLLAERGSLDLASWDAIGDAVGPGPLQALVASVRT